MTSSRSQLFELIKQRSLIFKTVTLASGQTSNYYFDGKMVLMASATAPLIGDVIYEMTKDLNLDAIGGPEIGAIPMATAAVLRYAQAGKTMEGFSVRKEVKTHGTQKRIEGMFKPGFRVAVVEDVTTQGTSALQAIECIQKEGGKIETVICLVDRLQGARSKLEAAGLKFQPVFTLRDFGLESPATATG